MVQLPANYKIYVSHSYLRNLPQDSKYQMQIIFFFAACMSSYTRAIPFHVPWRSIDRLSL